MTSSPGNTFNFNRYDYTSNNPINHIDPDGRCPDACIVEGGVVISASAVYVVAAGLVAAGVCVTSCGKIIKSIDNAAHSVIEKITQHNVSDSGKRRKNRIPDKGEPGTTKENDAGTTKKKYGEDGWVEKEWNKGHGSDAPDGEKEDHVHDHKPNPNHPDGRPVRQPGRKPTPDDMLGF